MLKTEQKHKGGKSAVDSCSHLNCYFNMIYEQNNRLKLSAISTQHSAMKTTINAGIKKRGFHSWKILRHEFQQVNRKYIPVKNET
jgi:hypothetical protein